MTKLTIFITSYNRNEMLHNLLKQIFEQAELDFDIQINIFDDVSDDKFYFNDPKIKVYTNPIHRGKQLFWQTWDEMFKLAKKNKSDYYFFLPDDIEICPNFFNIAIEKLEYIKSFDNNFACLSLLTDDQRKMATNSCWTAKQSELKYGEILSHFNDCCFICQDTFFELLDYKMNEVKPIRWVRDPNLSSGVGRQISLRLVEKEANMYHCFNRLVRHGEHESLMNPQERKNNPLTSNF